MSTRRRRRPANEIARILSPVSSPTSREITAKPRRIAATVRDVGSYITRSQRAPNGRSWLLDVDVFDETKRPFERGRLVGYVYRSGPTHIWAGLQASTGA